MKEKQLTPRSLSASLKWTIPLSALLVSTQIFAQSRVRDNIRFTSCGQFANSDQSTQQRLQSEANRDLQAALQQWESSRSPLLQALRDAEALARQTNSIMDNIRLSAEAARRSLSQLQIDQQQLNQQLIRAKDDQEQAQKDFDNCSFACNWRFGEAVAKTASRVTELENQISQNIPRIENAENNLNQIQGQFNEQLTELQTTRDAQTEQIERARKSLSDYDEANPRPVFETFYQAALEREQLSVGSDLETLCQNDLDRLRERVNSLVAGSSRHHFGVQHVTQMADPSSLRETSFVQLLPPVNDRDFPVVASGRECAAGSRESGECDLAVIEILSSSEKATPRSGNNRTDDLLIQLANEFNRQNLRTQSGKVIQIRVRLMASGTAYEYLSSGKYRGDENRLAGLGYSPSNSLWVDMLKARSERAKITVVPKEIRRRNAILNRIFQNEDLVRDISENIDGVVGNVAGIFVKKENFGKLFPGGMPNDSCEIIRKALDGRLTIGYTNPYVSSTGLNFLWTALSCLSPGNPLSDDAVAAFRQFQSLIPATYETTLSMRDAVLSGGSIDAGVIEYQSFVNARIPTGRTEVPMSDVFKFIPFGIRHDNPISLIKVSDLSEQQNREFEDGLQQFANFIAGNAGAVQKAQEYGFFGHSNFKSAYSIDSGESLITAQQIWKDNKTGGVPVVATFLADVSLSMREENRLQALRSALEVSTSFINPEMYVGLIEYGNPIYEIRPIEQFTDENRRKFVHAARNLQLTGWTPLYEALFMGLDQVIQKAKAVQEQTGEMPRMMVFLMTDGDANGPVRLTDPAVDAMVILAQHYGIQIHGIGLGRSAIMEPLEWLAGLTNAATIKINRSEDLERAIAGLFQSQL